MFVNLSNHPSAAWSQEQLEAAQAYGQVVDVPFPVVSPLANEQQLSALVDDYVGRVTELSPAPCVVHVMGEQTFCYGIVSRLTALGYTCVASTTERVVTDLPDGSKISKFCFVRYRKYGA